MAGSGDLISVTVLFGVISTLFTLVVAMGRAIIKHLQDENTYLKTQRDGVMATLVEVTKAQEQAIVTTGQFVRELAQQQDYERRKNNDQRGGVA